MKKSTIKKIKKYSKDTFNFLVRVGMSTSGLMAPFNPIAAAIAGAGTVLSTVSSVVKDRNLGKLAIIINYFAQNFGKAKNDRVTNA